MSKETITRCDRCGRFEEDDEVAVVVVASEAIEDDIENDLCQTCRGDLLLFLSGDKLARKRKPKPPGDKSE